MPLSLDEIKTLSSIDLEVFEIRGAKYGILNARSTGPLYVDGVYEPLKSELTGYGTFVSDSSIVSGVSLYPPYSSYDADVFRDGDAVTSDTSSYTLLSVPSSTSLELSGDSGLTGVHDFTCRMVPRDYLVEPDSGNNTVSNGTATFTPGSTTVNGSGTTWLTDVTSGDYIKPDIYQGFSIVDNVISDSQLELTSGYAGSPSSGTYTAKRRKVGRMYVRYTKDDFEYEKNGGRWELLDTTTASQIPTSKDYFVPMADGIGLKFTETLKSSDPDLSEVGSEVGKILAQQTEREVFQFPLPVVPNPESTFELWVNDQKLDMYPSGDKDYVLTYHQEPFYLPPPPVGERRIASVMFMDRADTTLDPEDTQTGLFGLVVDGAPVSGFMPGSENISVDGTSLELYHDYVVENDTGLVNVTDDVINENIVNYIGIDYSHLIDYGICITLDGTAQQYTVPPRPGDDVQIVLRTGRFKPANQDFPDPGQEYIVNYHVDGEAVYNETLTGTAGQTEYTTSKWPLKQDSVIVLKNGAVLTENEDFRVSFQTGRVVFLTALVQGDAVSVSYTPLSCQKNGMLYEDGVSYCKVYGARMTVISAESLELQLINPALDAAQIEIFSIENVTRNGTYDLTGVETRDRNIRLQGSSYNKSIGLSETDVVEIEYQFESETLEYSPVILTNFVFTEGSDRFYMVNQDSTSYFEADSVVRMTPSDAERPYAYIVDSVSYDGQDTEVVVKSTAPEDIINPFLTVTDGPVNFVGVGETASYVGSGSMTVDFPGVNIPNVFRENVALDIGGDIYIIRGAEYLSDSTATQVTMSTEALKNYDGTSLSQITYSDSPLYVEGDTIITTSKAAVDDPSQPGFTLYFGGAGYVTATSDASNFYVDTTSNQYVFPYSTYPTIWDLTLGIDAVVPDASTERYTVGWRSDHIIPVEGVDVSSDAPLLVSAGPALRYDGTDTNSFQVVGGDIVLDNPLVKGDRYHLDYQGLEYLGNNVVDFGADYFTSLAEGSKVVASFEYDLLDQFYIQVVSQRYFLENVIVPQAEEESAQLQGNAGQGGVIIGDENAGNSEGGTTNDEYERQDLEIECRVFDSIFDFFNDRVSAYGNELSAAFGQTLLNNDGTLSETDQAMATKSFNRMWTNADYTNFEPMQIAPLTGTAYGPGVANFTQGSASVGGTNTIWDEQAVAGDWIRPADTTENYKIQSVSATALTMDRTYEGDSVTATTFAISSNYPLFDDDGYTGPKINGTKESNFGLDNSDVFRVILDDATFEHQFLEQTPPLDALFPLSALTAEDVANVLTSSIPDLQATSEWIWDPSKTYGYRESIVLRTDTSNCMTIGTGAAVSKLGFTSGDKACGNRQTQESEYYWDIKERQALGNELGWVNFLISAGSTNKLLRALGGNIPVIDAAYGYVIDETSAIYGELHFLDIEKAALQIIMEEDFYPGSQADASAAYLAAVTFEQETNYAFSYDSDIVDTWEGKGDGTNWVLDFEDHTQYIRGVDSTDVGVPVSSGPGITPIDGQTTFIMQHPDNGHDIRILNNTVLTVGGMYYSPVAKYEDNNVDVDGTWSGWESAVSDDYSVNNEITFNMKNTTYFSIFEVVPNPSFVVDNTALHLDWTNTGGTSTADFTYSAYPTVQDLTDGINALDGFKAVEVYNNAGYDYTNLRLDASVVSAPPGHIIYVGADSPAMSIYSTDATPLYEMDSTSLTLIWDNTDGTTFSSSLLFATYPTIGQLETAVTGVSNFGVTSLFDPVATYGTLKDGSGSVAASAPGTGLLFDASSPVPLFRLSFDMTSFNYSVDSTALNVHWTEDGDATQLVLPYTGYPTVADMKMGISTITGLDTTGDPLHDASTMTYAIGSGTIPADIKGGLRPLYVDYQTISDEILDLRSDFIPLRDDTLADRRDFLNNTREDQIKDAVKNEEYFLSLDGGFGNLYIWANNRFNRRQGCDARLAQKEAQIAANESALGVTKTLV